MKVDLILEVVHSAGAVDVSTLSSPANTGESRACLDNRLHVEDLALVEKATAKERRVAAHMTMETAEGTIRIG